jgi:hypothetical protein
MLPSNKLQEAYEASDHDHAGTDAPLQQQYLCCFFNMQAMKTAHQQAAYA